MAYQKFFILFCEHSVLTSRFFGTPLRSHSLIFSPQIMQEDWLTYCSMKMQNYLCDKLWFWFLDFLCPNISYFLWTVYMLWIFIKKTVRMHPFLVNIRICQPSKVMSTSPSPRWTSLFSGGQIPDANLKRMHQLYNGIDTHWKHLKTLKEYQWHRFKKKVKKKKLTIWISIFLATMMKTCWGHLFKISPCKTFLEHNLPA